MFDITPDDINLLNDIDLRELVGRLCEAELVSRGLSPAAATWGGNQTAADGGLDVRVALPPGVSIEGFVPRPSTGFQVKKPDMPRAEIIAEMRPAGVIRPIIQELADEAGAYVIVSSTGSTADSALRRRQNALREALDGAANTDQLHTDFYDRTRLATWVRRHPGLITWVRERVGRSLVGWRPYGAWSSTAEGVDAEYLIDDKLRLHLSSQRNVPELPIDQGIDELRAEVAQLGKAVRLVGLSGVGKTRLVQALFDARIGSCPLPPSFAVYTNLSDNPDPQPTGLATDLIANRMHAVLIVDNCPPDLHRRLADLCRGDTSTVSVLTVEYDVRDDQPEGTQVFTLDTSSPELIKKLLQRRYSNLSQVDARTIAEASGGNARIAIALAETVDRSDTIAGLSNDELFQRLFRQRQDPNDALLLAAQACSLVYSFQGEALTGEAAELPRLAALAGQTESEIYRHVGELLRRELVQQRGVWRAVLPHAIANRLAARALEDTPYDLINLHLVEGGTARLAQSFSRRLSFLHDHPRAVAIVDSWLKPDGLLGDVTTLNNLSLTMFENVTPVLPEAAMLALERAGNCPPDMAMTVWSRHLSLLRSLAYDPPLFERSAQLLAQAVTQSREEGKAKEATDAFVSLFTICLSGTHATIEQRLGVIEQLLRSGEAKAMSLGLAALDAVLEAAHFSSGYRFEFGARSRDFGYRPRSRADINQWYEAALMLIERLALTDRLLKNELCDLLARNFRGLWTSAHMYSELEGLSRRIASEGFWREGWAACRKTMRFDRDRLTPEEALRLSALETDLRPSSLPERVRAVVLSDSSGGLDLEDMDVEGDVESAIERLDLIARELGAEVAADDAVFSELLLDLLKGGSKALTFGRGLAAGSSNPGSIWARLIEGLKQLSQEQRSLQVLRGFIAELWDQDRDLAHQFLDTVSDVPALLVSLPELHSAVELDDRGVVRLKRALRSGKVPVSKYQALAGGRVLDYLESGVFKDFLQLIANQPDGFNVALEILSMRLYSDRSKHREHAPELLEAGQDLLRGITFCKGNQRSDYNLEEVVRACLTAPDADSTAAEVAVRLRQAVATCETYAFDNDGFLTALIEVQPFAVLDALFTGDERDQQAGVRTFEHISGHRANPADAISCEVLIDWCEADRERRYPLAALIITFAIHHETGGALVWSEQAKVLLSGAPDPKNVLAVFIQRFYPMEWSGSRAALMEANARLLDSLESQVRSGLIPYVNEAKALLAKDISRQWQSETEQDRACDERFE